MLRYPSASFTRPNDTTAYAQGDLIANSTTAGSVTPLRWVFNTFSTYALIRRILVTRSNTTAATTNFRLFLFDAAPTVTNGDNAAFAGAFGQTILATFTGTINLEGNSNGRFGVLTPEALVAPAALPGPLWGLLTADGAYTPVANEVFTLRPEVAEVLR